MAKYNFKSFVNSGTQEEKEEKQFNFKSFAGLDEQETKTNESVSSKTDTAIDSAISLAQGVATGVTYLIDLPQTIQDGFNFVMDNTFGRAIFGMDTVKKAREFDNNLMRIEPGKVIRDNLLTYQPKTLPGQYLETAGEFAAPGGILAKGTKARALFAGTGFGSGVVAQGTEQLTGSEGVGTGVGVGVNLAADLIALSRGNVAGLAKNVLPSEKVIQKSNEIQKFAKDRGLNLTVGETTGSKAVQQMEADVFTSQVGAKISDDYYATRPDQLKTFILNFGKENGLITKSAKINNTGIDKTLKKSAALLQANRQRLWELSGGNKLKESFFNQVDIDNIVANIAKIETKAVDKSTSGALNGFIERLQASQGNGANLQNVYKDVRDLGFSLSDKASKSGLNQSERFAQKSYQEIANEIDSLLATNPNWKVAQTKYKDFTKNYVAPFEKTKVFKSIENAKWTDDNDTVGKLYRLFYSDKLTPLDVRKLAKSFNKTQDKNAWTKIMSGYFENAFIKAQADNLTQGLNIGSVFNKALVGNPQSKENVVEMFFQVAKNRGYTGSRQDMKKAIESFSDVLKSSGMYAKSGSPTAQRAMMQERMGDNKITTATQGFPGITGIGKYFQQRTYSKNAELFSKKLLSDEGIDGLIDLAKNWKDTNAAIGYVRALTIGTGEM